MSFFKLFLAVLSAQLTGDLIVNPILRWIDAKAIKKRKEDERAWVSEMLTDLRKKMQDDSDKSRREFDLKLGINKCVHDQHKETCPACNPSNVS